MTPQEIRYECLELAVHRSPVGIVDKITAKQIVADARMFELFVNGSSESDSIVD